MVLKKRFGKKGATVKRTLKTEKLLRRVLKRSAAAYDNL